MCCRMSLLEHFITSDVKAMGLKFFEATLVWCLGDGDGDDDGLFKAGWDNGSGKG